MPKSYKVAVVGATGLVGREMTKVLEERAFPVSQLIPVASPHTAGTRIQFRGESLTVGLATPEKLDGAEIVLMSAGGKTSAELTPDLVSRGAVVIDNSSQWRLTDGVPLVVPEVNAEDIAQYSNRGIIANPNCSTIQMVVALSPLHREATVKRVVVATYQAVSGKGKHALDELGRQVSSLFNQREIEPHVFPKRIAFNCLPHIDDFREDGFTGEEQKMLHETRKILHAPSLGICATCVRVPVFNGHGEAVNVELERPLTAPAAKALLRKAPGVLLLDDPDQHVYPTQIDAEGSDATYVGRIREDRSVANGLAFWCVADNLRKGAASNAVQIAEILARDYL